MDRFWIFLEAFAGILMEGQSIERLEHDLAQMEQTKRDNMTGYLRVVVDKVPHLITDNE